MLTCTITIEAKTFSGITDSLREILRHSESEVYSAVDGNEDENYQYEVTGSEEEED